MVEGLSLIILCIGYIACLINTNDKATKGLILVAILCIICALGQMILR